jgi:hypothetical protein
VVDTGFTPTTVDRRYLPGRGILGSVMVHLCIVSALLWLPAFAAFTEGPRRTVHVTMIDLRDPNYRLYLPLVGGGDPDVAPPAEIAEPAKPAPFLASPGTGKGLTFPGRQPMVSDFSKLTNRIETVLQPTLIDPPALQPLSVLPNIVRMAETVPPMLAPPRMPELIKPVEPEPPVLLTVHREMKVADPAKPLPAAADLPRVPLLPVTVQDAEPLLALTPMPAPREETPSIPAGEARGRFAVSEEAGLSGSEPGAKSDISLTADDRVGTGSVDGISSLGNTSAKDRNVGVPTDAVRGGRGPVTSGSTPGSGDGLTFGDTVGAGKDAFPGISILGGTVKGGTTAGIALSANAAANIISINGNPLPLQTSYGVTILSTETSGGGLPQFGVFSNEQIYTVYLDMRRTITDTAPEWTFEYAVVRPADPPTPSKAPPPSPARTQQGLVLPFPISRERPAFPEALVRKYLRRRLIVYAIINLEGKVEQMAVKETPDALLNEPVLRALSNWSFKPAQLDGEVVPVKVLMGIPVYLAQ